MEGSSAEPFRSYVAPRDEGGILCQPPFDDWSAILDANRRCLTSESRPINGSSFDEARETARAQLVNVAQDYSARILNHVPGSHDRGQSDHQGSMFIVGGHQPELFHAGVWYKNALLAKSVERYAATAIHLQVDHDLCRSFGVKVPTRDDSGQWIGRSVLIEPLPQILPWQMQYARDIEAWKSFPERVREATSETIPYPMLLDATWPTVIESIERGLSVGEAFSAARFRWEREAWGWRNLEVPMSHLIPCSSFGLYWKDIVSNLPRFHDVYHQARDAYRQHHRIRNEAHPVPALGRDGDWWEAPFWIYESRSPQRKSLWCRRLGDRLQCSDRQRWNMEIDLQAVPHAFSDFWQGFEHDQIHIRPRALTMTLYARWFLSDLFLHGIGGGKYDQMTDLIGSAWYGHVAPVYAVASATRRLPLAYQPSSMETPSQLKDRMWRMRHHPERELGQELQMETQPAWSLAKEKNTLLQAIPPRGEKWSWHQRMMEINQTLRRFIPATELELREQLPMAESLVRQKGIALSREYAWCLYPQHFHFA